MKANILKLGEKISKKSDKAMQGIVNSTKKFGKSIKKNARIKQRLRITKKKFSKRMRERRKRREEELQLEQQQQQDKDKNKDKESTKESKSGGPFGRLMSILQTLLIGFVVNKLPQIMDFIKKVIKVIRDIVDKFKNFFDGVKDFFKQIGNVINKAKEVLSNLSFDKIKEKVVGAFDKFKESFGNIKKNLSDGIKNFLKLKKKKPKEELKRNLNEEDLENKKKTTSVEDMSKTLTSISSDWNDTVKDIEKRGTGVDIVGHEFITEEKINTDESEKIKSEDVNTKSEEIKTGKLDLNSSGGGDANGEKTNTDFSELNIKKGVKGVSKVVESSSRELIKGAGKAFETVQSNMKSVDNITPERRGPKVIVTGNNNKNIANSDQRSTGGRVTIVKKDNIFKKLLDLALTS
tara:strand:- start:3658 stop:4875 length:1218 start_codon:yes stop_codon:yes gene_type:complete